MNIYKQHTLLLQSLTKLFAEGKTWSFIRWPNGQTHEEGFRGDTIVGGLTCKMYGYVDQDGSFACTGVFRQDGDKVYRLNPKSGDFTLVYDFGAAAGDVIKWGDVRIKVTGTDMVSARGHELRRVSYKTVEYLQDGEWIPLESSPEYEGAWIEGIGGERGPETEVPRPGVTGDYDRLLDISCGGEILCSGAVFYNPNHEKAMLSCKPEWSYTRQVWEGETGNWGEAVECMAVKTGMVLPEPGMFAYTSVAVHEDEDYCLLLRESDKVYAEKESFRQYMSLACPGMDDCFEEQAEWPYDVVLYDFTLNAGDRYPCRGDVTVVEVSTVTTRDGMSRKLMHLSNGLLILQGIGCINSSFGIFAYQNDTGENIGNNGSTAEAPKSAPACFLQSFRKYGDTATPIFILSDMEMTIDRNEFSKTGLDVVYDLQGRRLQAAPAKGLYIRGGKKYLVR